MKNWKQYLPDVLAVLLFAVISFAYFFPADIDGKVLFRHDSQAGVGLGHEAQEYRDRTDGDITRRDPDSAVCRHIRFRRHTRVSPRSPTS